MERSGSRQCAISRANSPDAKFIEYEKSAHFPYLEEPERFAADVTAFLSEARPQK